MYCPSSRHLALPFSTSTSTSSNSHAYNTTHTDHHTLTRTSRVFADASTTNAAHFYLLLGLAGLPVYLGMGYVAKWVGKVALFIAGFMLMGAGLLTIASVERDQLSRPQVRFTGS